MMKRILAVFLVLILAVCAVPDVSFALTTSGYITDTISYTIDTDSGTLTISGTGAMPDCASNESNVWSRNSSVETVIIEDGITEIGKYCFYSNTYVKRVMIGDSVSRIGNRAFMGCSKLETVDCGGELRRIEEFAFSGCKALQSFFFPETVEHIGSMAFYNCTKITDIDLPPEIDYIYADAFNGTGFYNSLGSGINTVCGYTLEYKGTSVPRTVTVPEDARVVSIRTLTGKSGVSEVVLPNTLEKILTLGFFNLTSLRSVNVPESVGLMEDFCVGYNSDTAYSSPVKNESFKIYGLGGTEAERYAAEHDFSFECTCTEADAEFISYPDCLAGGTAVKGCRYCGKVYETVYVAPQDAHSYGAVCTVAPTCTAEGSSYRVCTRCGSIKTEQVYAATGHTPDTANPIYTPATCTEQGTVVFLCSACGEVCPENTMYLEALGHTASDEMTVVREASCTETGVMQRTCAVCGEVIETEEIPPRGHSPESEWKILVPSTCTGSDVTQGFRVKRCTVCGVAVEYEYYLIGDLNSDGYVNLKDLSFIKKLVAGNEEGLSRDNADFNCDGSVNFKDIAELKKYIAL